MIANKKGKNISGAALIGALVVLVMLSTFGCNRKSRNVLFDTPNKYEKMGLPMVHLYGDSTQMGLEENVNRRFFEVPLSTLHMLFTIRNRVF